MNVDWSRYTTTPEGQVPIDRAHLDDEYWEELSDWEEFFLSDRPGPPPDDEDE
jgi:hypothetical protein